ncbi:serine hydrolase domain-containing protein [Phenylobacterium aquaticum]|uniref:serine hydrolase domain-containing protein n=1 Tax=Phenylobacterium aquaticum TaxID=1763816 RepID=UPI001F5D7680|nr:serine hydrolase domain-containing protein [Phenylobacterium aquaticum]MCI3131546.1 beta-lactamase family protein [Phenylobacterium aquaticum]
MTRRVHLFATAFVAFGLGLGGCQAVAKEKPAAPVAATPRLVAPEAVGFDAERLKKLDAYMAGTVAQGRVAGMTTLLVRHGKAVEFNTYGQKSLATAAPMDRDAIFRIYSMSKPLTGVAMMILFEEGKWKLDDPVTKFVPEFKDLKVMTGVDDKGNIVTVPANRPPTMREIMSHTAGFGYGLGDKHPVDKLFRERRVLGSSNLQELINRMADIPLMFQPGTSWSYSASVDVQGYIVEKISGQKFGDFLQQRVFGPLKMNDTAFYTGPAKASRLAAVYVGDPKTGKLVEPTQLYGGTMPDYTKPPAMESGGGGLVSTTADYGRFAQMILNKGELDGVRILSPAAVELMGTNVIPQSVLVTSNGTSGARFNEAVGFGLDFAVVNDPRKAGSLTGKGEMSWGGAAGTWFWIDPTNDLYFVGMIQRIGGTGGDDLGTMARTLTYQALTHPEK